MVAALKLSRVSYIGSFDRAPKEGVAALKSRSAKAKQWAPMSLASPYSSDPPAIDTAATPRSLLQEAIATMKLALDTLDAEVSQLERYADDDEWRHPADVADHLREVLRVGRPAGLAAAGDLSAANGQAGRPPPVRSHRSLKARAKLFESGATMY